jgi:hypothetical protein
MAGRRGLVVPQNTFLDNIIKKTNGTRKFQITLLLLCYLLILDGAASSILLSNLKFNAQDGNKFTVV